MTNATLNGKRFKCPSCMEEMTVKQYVRIITEWNEGDPADRDYLKLLNILTDGAYPSYDHTIENDITLFDLVGWVITQPFEFKKERPKVLYLRDKLIDIPEPGELSIGQNIHLRRDYMDKSRTLEENIAIATAIYLQPIIENRKFHVKRAEELAKEIEQLPIHLIYPIGFFLLKRAQNFGTTSAKTWSRTKISLRQILRKMFLLWPKLAALLSSMT